MSTERDASEARLLTAHSLTLDVAAVEIIQAFRAAGIEPILLKGAALVAWLYDDGAARLYGDIDLLVAPADLATANRILERHGFRYGERGTDEIDLIDTISGPKVPPREVWRVLSRRTQPFRLLSTHVRVLDRTAQAFHVVVHAWKHGEDMAVPTEDLRRLLARLDDGEWPAVVDLARELDAVDAFSGGLALLPEGAALAERLHLSVHPSTETVLLRESAPPQLLLLDRAMTARGWRRRLAFLKAALAPPADTMRLRFGMARRGRRGLAAAYVLRIVRLTAAAPGALRVWTRARRRSAR